MTPAEKAGIKFPYKDWADVVRGTKKKAIVEVEDDKPQPILRAIRASPIKRIRKPVSRKPKRRVKFDTTVMGIRGK